MRTTEELNKELEQIDPVDITAELILDNRKTIAAQQKQIKQLMVDIELLKKQTQELKNEINFLKS
jgi:hypothetical protein